MLTKNIVSKCIAASGLCLSLLASAPASAYDITTWTCTGKCGTLGADGVVTLSPLPGSTYYDYVTTFGSPEYAVINPNLVPASILATVGTGSNTSENGSKIQSPQFSVTAGQELSFWFNYVSTDGSTFSDYAWARLLDSAGNEVAMLFAARTTSSGDTAPGFSMPLPQATLTPATAPIIPGGPKWSPLGVSDSGACFNSGCGYTGWVKATYTIAAAGIYRLEFGVMNWYDDSYNSGLAFDGAAIGGIPIGKAPDLTPSFSGPAILEEDQTEYYLLTITNVGNADSLAGSTVVVTLPAGAIMGPAPTGCVITGPLQVTCTLPAIAAGASITLSTTLTNDGTIPSNALLSADISNVTGEIVTSNNHYDLAVRGAPDLKPVFSGPSKLADGDIASYTLTISNVGDADSSDGTALVTLPVGVTKGIMSTGCDWVPGSTQVIICVLPPIAAGTSITKSSTLANTGPIATGALVSVDISGVTDELNLSNNHFDFALAGIPDLTPALTGPALLTAGQTGAYDLTISNVGDADSVDGLVTIDLPAGLTVVAASLPASCAAAGSQITCTLAGVAADDSTTLIFSVTATGMLTSNDKISATISAVTGEIITANNSTNLALTGAPDLVFTLTGPHDLLIGQSGHFFLTVTNQGDSASTDGTVTITLPPDATLDPSPLPRYCSVSGLIITCNALPPLLPGGSAIIPFNLTATAPFSPEPLTGSVTNVTGQAIMPSPQTVEVNAALTLRDDETQSIPTLSELALALLALLLAGSAATRMRRKG